MKLNLIALILSLYLLSCTQKDGRKKISYEPEIENQLIHLRNNLAKKLNVKTIENENYPCYHLMVKGRYGFKQSIRVEHYNGLYTLTSKTVNAKNINREPSNYTVKINKYEWVDFKAILDEFDFWEVDRIKFVEPVLHGSSYFLDGLDYNEFSPKTLELNQTFRKGLYNDKLVALIERIKSWEYNHKINIKKQKTHNT